MSKRAALAALISAATVSIFGADATATNALSAVANTAAAGLTNAASVLSNTATAVASTAAAAATNTAAAASTATKTGPSYFWPIFWVVVVGAVFGFLWSKGYLLRMRDYAGETVEELKKCAWPSVDELKGSTVVVLVTIALLGVFTVAVDWVLSMFIRGITS